MPRHERNVETWFWEKVDRSGGPRACWPWLGASTDPKRGKNGTYGRCRAWGTQTTAHRVALALHLGRDIRDGLFVLHSCNNPPCCNPAHLREGTHKDNMLDLRLQRRERICSADPAEPWEWTVGNDRRAEQAGFTAAALKCEEEANALPVGHPAREGLFALARWNREGRPSSPGLPLRRRRGARHG